MGLSAYKQIRFPGCSGAFGLVTLVINRPGNENLSQPATDTLILGEGGEYYPFITDGDFALSKKFTTTRGRRALDDLTVGIRDGLAYTGKVNGSDVSEDFTSSFQTFFDVWFTGILPYKAFILYHDNLTGNDEVTHIGWIDPTYKPSSDGYLFNALTSEQIWLGTRSIKMTAIAQAQLTLTWNDVLKNIGASDCQEGTAYNGFMQAPNGLIGQTNTRADLFSINKGSLEQAAIYFQKDWLQNPARVNVDPAIWPIAPWTSIQSMATIADTSLFHSGTGYAVGDTGTINGGSSLAHYEILTVLGGLPLTFRITDAGAGYSTGTNIATTVLTGTGDGTFAINILKVSTGANWGPNGLIFINLTTLFAKIADTIGITAPTVISALRWWKQVSSGQNFPIDTANPINPGDMYISLNVFAKCHPYDGSYWDNPVGFSPDTPITDVLSGICNMILSDFNITNASDGAQTLVLTPMGETSGALPDWTLIGTPQQEEPATGSRVVRAKYRADDLTIQSPLGIIGDASNIEIPARIHRIGKTSGADILPDAECLIFDSKLDVSNQENCLRIAWFDAGTGLTTIIPDCWKGLCYLYWFNSGASNPGVYPSNWKTLSETTDWSNSFFCVNAITRAKNPDGTDFTAAADLQAQINGNDYFNLRNYTAVAFAVLTLPQPTVQTLNFQGISDSSGSVQSIKAGLSAQWRLGSIADQNWVGIQIDQRLLAGETTIKFQQYGNVNGFPALTDLSYGAVNGTGGTSSTTGSATGGSSSGMPDPSLQDYDFPINTITLSAASTNNVAVLSALTFETQTVIVENTHGAAITITGILAPSQNCTIILYNSGSFNFTLSLNDTASAAANRINGGIGNVMASKGAAMLIYDTANTQWQIVNIFTATATDLTPAVILLPIIAHRNLIQPGATGVIPLEIKGFDTSSRLIQIKDYLGQVLFEITPSNISTFYGNVEIDPISSHSSIILNSDVGTLGTSLLSGGVSGVLSWGHFADSLNISSPNGTINTSALSVVNGSANGDFALIPKGTGAFILSIPDSTATGGNKRGLYSVDLQLQRSAATEIASGLNSVIAGGRANKADAQYNAVGGGFNNYAITNTYATIPGGAGNVASGQYSFATGNNNTAAGTNSFAIGSRMTLSNDGCFGFNGDDGRAMTVATNYVAVYNAVDLWIANNNNSAKGIKFFEAYNSAGAFPNTAKFAMLKAPPAITNSYTWLLPVADSAGYVKSDGSGNLSIDSGTTVLTGAVILNPLTNARNLIAPVSDIRGLSIQQFSSLGQDQLQVLTSGSVVTVALNATKGNNFGDVVGSNTGQPLYVRQFTSGGITSIFEDGGVGNDYITAWRKADNTTLAVVTNLGHFGTIKHVGAGTISPGYFFHVVDNVIGDTHQREENNLQTNDKFFDSVATTTNAVTPIHNISLSTGDIKNVWATIIARQTGGAGGVVGHTFKALIEFGCKNVAGVASLIANIFHINIDEDVDAETGLWNVTAAVNGTGIDIKVQSTNNNRNITWKIYAYTDYNVNI